MPTANVQELRDFLLKTDEEYRQLSTRHQELDGRLHELSGKPYLSEPEQVEEVKLKKQKLQLKDKMEDILRRHRAEPSGLSWDGVGLDHALGPFVACENGIKIVW